MIRQAVWYREKYKLSPLTVHINYYGESFVKSLLSDKWGEDTMWNVRLTLRQFEKHFIVKLYKDFELVKVLTNEGDLK